LYYLKPEVLNSLSLYAYCGSDPVNRIDPTGYAWWNWVISGVLLVGGIILCATGIGSVAGVGLIVAGTSSLISNIMDAAGVDSKLASQISAGIDIFAGLILLYTPFAGIGAAMIGSGIGSFGGGYISEALGGNYEFGSLIGSILGGAAGNGIYKGLQKLV
jgi:hypothetical protein